MGLLKNRYTITRGILEDRDPPLLEHNFIVAACDAFETIID